MRKVILGRIIIIGLVFTVMLAACGVWKTDTQKAIQYKVISFHPRSNPAEDLQQVLDEYANQGWELVLYDAHWSNLVFRK